MNGSIAFSGCSSDEDNIGENIFRFEESAVEITTFSTFIVPPQVFLPIELKSHNGLKAIIRPTRHERLSSVLARSGRQFPPTLL